MHRFVTTLARLAALAGPATSARHHAAAHGAARRATNPPAVLVYSKTAGYRHASIPTAINVIGQLANSSGLFAPTFSENENDFTVANLAQYSIITFLSNSDEILDEGGKEALLSWLTTGDGDHGLMGIHAGNAALFTTPYFGTALGAFFDYHPDLQNATFTVTDASNPATSSLPSRWNYVEEVYNYRSDPRTTNITTLMSVDLTSFTDPQRGQRPYNEGPLPQPIAWYREGGIDLTAENLTLSNSSLQNGGRMQGRAFYTSLGHTSDVWMTSTYQQHILGGYQWLLNAASPSNSSTSASPASAGQTGASASGAPTSSGGQTAASGSASSKPSAATSRARLHPLTAAAVLAIVVCTLAT